VSAASVRALGGMTPRVPISPEEKVPFSVEDHTPVILEC
jgi:hypothetical protein